MAVGGAVPSCGANAGAALDARASIAEVVDVWVGVLPIVGAARGRPGTKLAMALGYDADALDQSAD